MSWNSLGIVRASVTTVLAVIAVSGAVALGLVTGCTLPLAAPQPTPTAIPRAVDYKAIRQPLLIPLGALIVAVRSRAPTTAYWLDQFNKAADQALPQIAGDTSVNAMRLHTSIETVRARPNDLDALEASRSALLEIG